ncbi:MAG: electron transfer flavoprotein subunit beta/FixA family protein, partial [Actinomycetota bacterium]|nr:electron transfer flavoprotein subunit beta/FixA family protein [Actinomycetota bacterium]
SHATGPLVLGIQAARQAPRYVPISRIRQAMSAGGIEVVEVEAPSARAPKVTRLFAPEAKGRAEMLGDKPSEVAARIVELIRAKGVSVS